MTFWILLPEAVVSRIHQLEAFWTWEKGVGFRRKSCEFELIGEAASITSRRNTTHSTRSTTMEEPASDEFVDGEKHQGDAEDEDDQGSGMDGTGSSSLNEYY